MYRYKTQGVCSRYIDIELDGKIIKDVHFEGGCNGNLKAMSKIIKGKNIDEVIEPWEGNTCGGRSTSCADQLTIALKEAYEAQNK
ncbi:MAG: TIGR03905 family TSCPD domain-containing protein [Eggerthellaceae bacterium]|nr:TIGR03905 family TSCPD domain-containing protein [Eggerthellaceae bacterium]